MRDWRPINLHLLPAINLLPTIHLLPAINLDLQLLPTI